MDFVYGSGQIVGVEQFYTYFTYVAIYVVNVGIIFVLAPRGDFSHVEMCIFESTSHHRISMNLCSLSCLVKLCVQLVSLQNHMAMLGENMQMARAHVLVNM